MNIATYKNQFIIVFIFLVIGFINSTYAQVNTEETPFIPRALDSTGNSFIQLKGDYTFLSNSVMNRILVGEEKANTPYSGNQSNNSLHVEYVDIDNDDDTFSSSSSTLTLPDCSQIYYAGLYWAGNYNNERLNSNPSNHIGDFTLFPVDNTRNDFSKIKFKVPGGNYIDLQADINADPMGEEDDIIIDGLGVTRDDPYVCYKNVTNQLQALADPRGEYTVANVRGTKGTTNHGVAGWTLVIVYENPTFPGRYISVFDGYEGITTQSGNRQTDISFSGFQTIPSGNVEARIGVSAIEGESSLSGDVFSIRSNSDANFSPISNPTNPTDNFFNSTITRDAVNVGSRNINSTNAMGYDSDVFNLDNPGNSFIDNGDTSATLRLGTSGDWFAAFLVTFGIEIIEPDIVLEKKVRQFGADPSDPASDITGLGVNLGQDLIYELSYQNIGNDDATNYTIRDILPVNTSFVNVDFSGAPGATLIENNPTTGQLTFSIPDSHILEGAPVHNIRIHVKVAEDCFDFINACSDQIENIAYSTYEGVQSNFQLSDDPSVKDFNDCGFVTPGASNFLLDDLSDCTFTRTEELCSNSLTLTAGTGFDEYIWVRDNNGDNTIDSGDTVLLNGGPNDNSFTVTNTGTYIIDKIVADPCKGFKEIIIVERFGTTQTNPILDLFNTNNSDADPNNDIQGEITVCSIDGRELPNIFLCGANDSELLTLNINDANSTTWEVLDENTCNLPDPSCPITSDSCYTTASTGNSFNATSAGSYRVVIELAGGCNSTFYFNVFQNDLEIIHTEPRDIICDTPGNITITNLGNAYGYQLFDITNNTIAVPFSANNGPSFDIQPGDGGAYRIDVVQLNSSGNPIDGACIFQTENFEILDRTFQVDITSTPANCNALGSINIQALNVSPDYYYALHLTDGSLPPAITDPDYFTPPPLGTFIDDETAQSSNNFTFSGLNPNQTGEVYYIVTSTADGCFDAQPITVNRDPDPTLSAVTTQNIGCTAGTISLTANGGPEDTSYSYAIWSRDGSGTDLYASISDIPGSAYQSSPIFTFGYDTITDEFGNTTETYIPGEEGDYIFIVFDSNNCSALSNVSPLLDNGTMSITSIDEVQPSCSGDSDGSLTINISNGVAPFLYSIDGGTTTQSTPLFAGLIAGTYTINVTDSSGCDESQIYVLSEPFPFSASAGVSRDVSCNPSTGAEVRITNVVGGTEPYSFSFDGGTTFGASQTASLLPGIHNLIARDASLCEFPITIEVEDLPTEPLLTLSPSIEYNCDGTGSIVIASDIDIYDYTYEIDDVFNSPPTSNTFNDLPARSTPYKITTNYTPQTPPTASVLLVEDFGFGPTIPNPNTSAAYYYEDQLNDNTPSGSTNDTDRSIDDFEYAVTSNIEDPFNVWFSPIDHTSGTRATNGRYLVVNLGDITDGETIYQQTINDIIPNQDLEVSLWAINLVRANRNLADPNLTIELRHTTTNALIASSNTGFINETGDWVPYTIPLNPGSNTSLNLIITSTDSEINGSDIAIDDILVEQTPEVCELSIDTFLLIEPNNEFTVDGTASTDVSCNGLTDGTITFSVENFGASFEYSVDGIGGTYINSTTSPVTTAAVFGAGSQTIHVRRTDDFSCATTVTRTISQPDAIVASGTITAAITCNDNATITASASGGVAPYHYELQNVSDNSVVGTFSFATNTTNTTFDNLPAGNYQVVVRDRNGNGSCPDVSDPINIIAPTAPTFTATPILCYSGNNDGTITVNVTGGNGTYLFSIDGDPFVSPNGGATTHTFNNLANGTYTIDVQDTLGCEAPQQNVTINPELRAIIEADDISCNDGNITINTTGGDGNYQYAFVTPSGTPVTNLDFGTTNTLTVTTTANYDVYVRDNNNNSGIGGTIGVDFCQVLETITVAARPAISITTNAIQPQCFDENGSIELTINSGDGPYTLAISDGTTTSNISNFTGTTHTFFNLTPGTISTDYTVTVTDAHGCPDVTTETITNPEELTAEVEGIAPVDCDPDPNLYGFSFINFPTTLGTLEFSADGGTTWQTSNTFVGPAYASGTEVEPSIRTVSASNVELCRTDLPRYTIPFPLDELNISVFAVVVDCNDLQVTVQGTEGFAPYEYTYSDDPTNFDPATATWILGSTIDSNNDPVPVGHGRHVFTGLIPGRTYVFYVRDITPCVRETPPSVNVNLLDPPPVQITSELTPTCDGLTNGQITYTVTENNPGELGGTFDWELFRVGTPSHTSIATGTEASFVSGDSFTVPTPASLPSGDYFIQINGAAPNNCIIGSENVILEQLDPITFTPNVVRNITCASNGIIEIQNPQGGGGIYTYTLSSSNFTTNIVTTDNPIEIPISSLVDSTVTPFDILVEIEDQFSCPVTSLPTHTVSITVAQSPTIGIISTDNCETPYSFTVPVTGGLAPYLYSNDGGATYLNNGGIFNNVSVDIHNISVIDANGCTDTDTVEIFPALQASATITELLHCTSDAEITIEASGGSGSYEYSITNTIAGVPNVAQTTLTSPLEYQAPQAGDYEITVFDTNTPNSALCNRVFTLTVVDAIEPVLNIDPISVSNETCEDSDNGSFVVTAANNGTGPFTFEITASSDAAVTVPIAASSSTDFSATFTGLTGTASGITYTVTATADNGCHETIDQVITQPEPIVITLDTPVEFGCAVDAGNNQTNASITIQSVAGGSGNYVSYKFINSITGNEEDYNDITESYIETNFAGGSYTIIVTDDNGCTGMAVTSIPPFDELQSAPITQTSVLCAGETISIDAISTFTNFSSNPTNYEFREIETPENAFSSSNIFTGLTVGLHSFEVRNIATRCSIIVQHTVENPNTFDFTVNNPNDITCNGDTQEITIEITDDTYTGSFNWEIFETNGTQNNELDDTSIISGSSAPNSITLPINLDAGNYRVSIAQAINPGCTKEHFFNITEPTEIMPNASMQANPTCSDDQGSILVSPSGGKAPYTITLSNGVGYSDTQTNVGAHLFEGLSGGIYDVSIVDNLGCIRTFTSVVTLQTPEAINADATATALACFNESTASVTANIIGVRVFPSAPVYQYQLNTYDSTGTNILTTSVQQGTATFSNLSAGMYSITVTDDFGCSHTTEIETIINPTEVRAELRRTQALTCGNLLELELSATGGSGNYEYSTDNINFTLMTNNPLPLEGLLPDTYQFYVRDADNGCTAVLSNEITEDPIEDLILNVNPITSAMVSCNGEETGIILVDAEGGLGNYMYELFTDPTLTVSSRIAGPQTLGEFRNLPSGNYYATVTSDDCPPDTRHIFIDQPTPLVVIDENDFTDATCFGANNGTITVELQGGSGEYQYAISPNLDRFDSENVFDELSPGVYTVIAQDKNGGCFVELEYTIDEPQLLQASAITTPEVCAGEENGVITITMQGGTAPYSTRIDGEADFVDDRLTISNLAAGTHLIFIRDAQGCETNVFETIDAGANLNATVEPIYECIGDTPTNFVNILLEDESVIGDVLYGLDVTDPNNPDANELQLNPDFRNSAPGTHTITIAHSNGCVENIDFEIENYETLTLILEQNNINEITAIATGGRENYTFYFEDVDNGDDNTFYINRTDTYVVRVVDENGCESLATIFIEFIDIEIPNFFTPDGDGLNDLWMPRNMDAFPEILTIIFDRYGREVYRLGLGNPGWDGLYKESELPTGDYWYIIKLNGEEDNREFVGHFTLYR